MRYKVWDDFRLIPSTIIFGDLMQIKQFRELVQRKLEKINKRQATRLLSSKQKSLIKPQQLSAIIRKPYTPSFKYRNDINNINEKRPIYTFYVKLERYQTQAQWN